MKQILEYFRRNRSVGFGSVMLGFLILVAISAPLVAEDPFDIGAPPFTAPNAEFLMGTDFLGRDVLAMMAWGTRIALLFAIGAAGISLVFGVLMGAVSGYVSGILDDLFSRTFELFIIIPRTFLIILLVAIFGANIWLSVLIIGATMWPSNARIMRAQVLSLKSRGYVQAAIVSGASDSQVLFRHIVPNGISPVLANSTLQMAHAVLIEAGLSFLGLGDLNVVSWGQILYTGQNYMTSNPQLVLYPGIAIIVLLMSLHLLGSGLLEALKPHLQAMSA